MSIPYLRYDHLGREAANAGDGGQHFDGCAKGFYVAVDLLIDAGKGRIESIDLVQMKSQHEAVMSRHPATQRRPQFPWGGLEASVR
jgi:uncharacterized protein with FMN-binding domain